MSEAGPHLEEALAALEELADDTAREAARRALASVLALHGDALGRILAALDRSPDKAAVLQRLTADAAVASVLALHGLHPVPLKTRVEGALREASGALARHGLTVELVAAGAAGDAVELAYTWDQALGARASLVARDEARRLALQVVEEAAPDAGEVVVARERTRRERCDLCGALLPADRPHRHLAGAPAGATGRRDKVSCACEACALLFPGRGELRAIPARAERLDGLVIDEATWAELAVPVRLVFFVRTAAGPVRAHYPSPGGVVEAEVELAAWETLTQGDRRLASMEPEVEALLVDGMERGAATRTMKVPIDAAYRLAGLLRASWEGLQGGPRAREATRAFWREMECGPHA